MSTEDTYLRSVERMLAGIAPEHRGAVLDDLRAHFADAEAEGRPLDETIRTLGAPRQIAERAREEFGADDSRPERAWRVLQGSAVAVAVITGVVAAFLMPRPDPASVMIGQSLIPADGPWLALVALLRALIAAAPLFAPRRFRTPTAAVAALVLTAAPLLGTIVMPDLFLPTAALTWAALIVWTRLRGSGFGIGWRITGAALAAAPSLFAVSMAVAQLTSSTATTGAGTVTAWGWVILLGVLLIAAVMVTGYRSPGWVLATLGLTTLVGSLLSTQLLTLLFVWLGGLWLTVGLAHAVTARRR
ncbi:DUF1700 domain-containing protein [Microbacterium esteraromaticum]|uniref:HAAS signaling domain-containing protein n=1 Tax=Microbacterium esteraromaticum TaxID=57043 RepID=UPI001A9042BB|nr:DUF1700 domain-containing protein [Microbacterium esteraromaticum]MBN8424945.1 DUF1700 domain-containing protein [Microbacterium esteraromaticum]